MKEASGSQSCLQLVPPEIDCAADIGLASQQSSVEPETLDAIVAKLAESADSLAVALAEARRRGPGTERRCEAQKLLKKYSQIKSLKLRVTSGETLHPLQVAKLRSEVSVLRALACYWESEVHLEFGDVADVDEDSNLPIGEGTLAISHRHEDMPPTLESSISVKHDARHHGHDLADIIARSEALNEKSRSRRCENPEKPSPPLESLPQAQPVVQKSGIELTPWQLATRRAKREAALLAPPTKVKQKSRVALGVTTQDDQESKDAMDNPEPSEAIVRRRWGNQTVQDSGVEATKAKAPTPPCSVVSSGTNVPHPYAPPLPTLCAMPKLANSLSVSIVGDSGLQLNKSKGIAGFESDLRYLLGPNVEVVRFPGEGAKSITHYLQNKHGSVHVAIAVWFLNELFDRKGLVTAYPPHMNTLAKGLAGVLKMFPFHVAVIGGAACLWNVSGEFDIWAERVRDVVSEQGVCVVDGIDGYCALQLTSDHWHARSTPENKARMAAYFANLVRMVVADRKHVWNV